MKSLLHLAVLLMLCRSPLHAQSAESTLMQGCGKGELSTCERLGAYYLAKSDWNKAFLIGEALCGKDLGSGCLVAGSSLLAMDRVKEGSTFLSKACDKFEPLSCRSLSRLLEKSGEPALANMYLKRSCFYGFRDVCDEVRVTKTIYSPAALGLIESISRDCVDTQAGSCLNHLTTVKSCALPLNKLDCQLLAGHLSLFFRAKFIQAEAKVVLLSLHASEKRLKEAPVSNSYSYDLALVQKNATVPEKHHYVFGFMRSCGKKYVKARRPVTDSRELHPKAYKHIGPRTTSNIIARLSKGQAEDCYDPQSGFEAYAVGNLDPLDPSRLDVWKIDQDQRLQHVEDGLPLP